jgi:hypothetical protein
MLMRYGCASSPDKLKSSLGRRWRLIVKALRIIGDRELKLHEEFALPAPEADRAYIR